MELQLVGGGELLGELQVPEHDRERVVDLVRDPRRERTDRRQPVGVHQPSLELARLVLGVHPLADVVGDADEPRQLAVGVVVGVLRREQGLALDLGAARLVGPRLLRAQHLLVDAVVVVGALGPEELAIVLPEDRLDVEAQQRRPRRVDEDVATVQVLDEDGVASALDHAPEDVPEIPQLGLGLARRPGADPRPDPGAANARLDDDGLARHVLDPDAHAVRRLQAIQRLHHGLAIIGVDDVAEALPADVGLPRRGVRHDAPIAQQTSALWREREQRFERLPGDGVRAGDSLPPCCCSFYRDRRFHVGFRRRRASPSPSRRWPAWGPRP